MLLNKEIIIRIVLGAVILFMFIKIVVPIFFETIKRKIPGSYNPEDDIDSMIRRQKEKLRAQYGISEKSIEQTIPTTTGPAPSKELETLYKETRWGGGEFAKGIQNAIAKNFSYTLAESKVNAFVLLAEKKNYVRFLNHDNQKSPEAIKNYFSVLMLFLIMIEEMRNKELNLLERAAKKCHVSPLEFMLALQLKVLFAIKSKVKDERLFEDKIILHQFSEDSIKEATEAILSKEANLWAKGAGLFFEELSLYLSYADVLAPLPKLENKKDLETAYAILKMNPEMDLEEIKKGYKKIAMARHPDKIGQMKLPSLLEKKALGKFNYIQEAYDIVMASRKK